MVGGKVIEVSECRTRPEALYIDVADAPYKKTETCAILVEKNAISQQIQLGDTVWWQGRLAMWTPQNSPRDRQGVNFDVQIPRIGYSGVMHPDRRGEDVTDGQEKGS